MIRRLVFALVIVLANLTPALAINPEEVLDNPALEVRAREISAQLRCLVCQNQSIDSSDAELARDLRILVRDRLKNGDSNEDVVDYVVSRYGEFVLLKPRFSPQTWLLWGAPGLLIIFGAFMIWRFARRSKVTERPLSLAEEMRLEKLLSESDLN